MATFTCRVHLGGLRLRVSGSLAVIMIWTRLALGMNETLRRVYSQRRRAVLDAMEANAEAGQGSGY